MTDPQTISEAFIRWMEDYGFATFGTDVFLNQIPDENGGSYIDNAYWVITSGGDVKSRNVTAESIQQFSIQVFYRNTSGKDVERNLYALNKKVNTRDCFSLNGFELHDMTASLPEDNDRDAENRAQGSFVVDIQVYVSYIS